ncbi:MAG: hypothetical protein JW849_00815 [Phycisphaerae bacterium]|nr:hypothetical protein [Phycisphaerae bacterium]
MSVLLTDNIDRLQLHALRRPLGWRLTFRSGNDGLVHQLYVNGRLADATDTTTQRFFEISAQTFPQELAVAAVAGEFRHEDHFAELPAEAAEPAWVYRPAVLRHVQHRPGDRIAVYHDSAGGTMGQDAALSRELWPAGVPHWGWGRGGFARGGFGLDADLAPGFGAGPWGAGPLGVDVEPMDLAVAMTHDGPHAIELRVATDQGQTSAALEDSFTAHPPPAPLKAITATNYDPNTHMLSVTLVEES